MRTVFRTCLVVLSPIVLRAQAVSASAITIGRIDSVFSTTLKEKRRYLVYTPPSYTDSLYTPRTYPVLYLLDGDAHFHSVTGLIQALATGVNGTFVIPEMIVVAIPNTNRMRDLSPTNTAVDHNGAPERRFAGGGGLASFLRFLQTELIPRIDSSYRTAPYRMLVGHSLGGIAAINALYTMPATFNAYVAIDPSLWWDKRLLLNQAKPFFSQRQPAGRALYVALANTLDADDSLPNGHYNSIVQFNRVLEAYNTSGIRYGFRYYPNDDHGSVPLIAEYDALRFLFDRYRLELQAAIKDTANVTAHFARVSGQLGYTVRPPEAMVAMLSQAAQSLDSAKVAPLLELNTQLYPRSARAFLALGDYRVARKDSSRARIAYVRAAAIDPSSARARDAVRRLGGTP
jgi:uncharacterized protein